MIKQNQRVINFLNITSDAALIFCSFYFALYVRFEFLHGHTSLKLFSARYLLIVAGYSLLLVLVYAALRMYGSYRFKEPGGEITTILLVNGVAVLSFMAFLYVTRVIEFPRLAVFLFWPLSSAAVIGKRTVVRGLLRHYRKLGYNQKHVLLVGSGPLARQYLKDVAAEPHLGVVVDGYLGAESLTANLREGPDENGSDVEVSADTPTQGDKTGSSLEAYTCPCLGSYDQLEPLLERQTFDEVIVALEPHEVAQIKPVIAAVEKQGVRVSLIPFYSDYIPSHPVINAVGRSKLIDLRAMPLDNLGWAICKRGMDIIGSIFLIILTSPIMLITAIGVKLSSPDPVFFKQERIGKDCKPFQMVKFRSMRVTGTEATGWSTNTDPRKTRFGSLIRKFSIDELPQLFCTLAGSMSLVGPRPEVHGLQGDTSIEERVKYDVWYIENRSLWLDIRILFKDGLRGDGKSRKTI